MKLAFCLFKYFPYGGLQRDFMQIAERCLQRGHQVDVYTQSWQGEIPAGFNIILLESASVTNHGRCKSFSAQLQARLANKSYDVVVGFNRMPGLDIYFSADLCFTAQSMQHRGMLGRLLPRNRVYKNLERSVFASESPTQVLVLTEEAKRQYQQYYQTPDSRFSLLPPGIDSQRLKIIDRDKTRQTVRDKLNLDEHDFLLLSVGSNYKTKGLHRTLQAIASLQQTLQNSITLCVIGTGKIERFKNLAQSLGITDRVKFLGPQEHIAGYYAAADFLVHPAYYESAGMVLLEALVSGLPVLVTASCGYAYHVARAHAGIVLSTPFKQQDLNTVLVTMLNKQQLLGYRQQALEYAGTQNLDGLHDEAVTIIESKGQIA